VAATEFSAAAYAGSSAMLGDSAVDSDNQLLLLLGIRHPTRKINVIGGRLGRHGRTGNYSCLSARYLVSSNDGPANVVLSRQKNGAPLTEP
jgi:hypothetical protein